MLELKTQFLCTIAATLPPPRVFGATPQGVRVIGDITGGKVTGPRMNGILHASGADWLSIGTDGCGRIDVRALMELEGGALVYVTYNGRLDIPPALAAQTANRETVESVDPGAYYFRTAPTFETAAAPYAWLNKIQAIGVGRLTRTGVEYSVYEVL